MHNRSRLRCIRASALIALLAALAVGLVGCAGDDETAAPTTAPTATTVTTTGETSTNDGGIDTFEDGTTSPLTGDAAIDETALLEGVTIGRHEGFDRIVFRFRNGVPGYRVEYVEPPLREDGSGNVVKVAGDAFVVVRMEPASGFDLTTGEGELVYTGPKRLQGSASGTSVLREAVRTGDFEAVLTWAVGLSDPVAYRVLTLENPARLVVDFQNH